MTSTPVQPVQSRIAVLDVLRGFALFGVLLVNMLDFSGSALRVNTLGERGTEIDQIIDISIAFFALTKFYLLFSLLFGIGFAVQMRRVEGSGRSFTGFYLRRLLILFVIGMAHAVLLWDGDILRLYAVAGVLLLWVRSLSTRLLLGAALIVTLAGLLYFATVPDFTQMSTMAKTSAVELYRTGSYPELVSYRLNQNVILDIQIPMVLVMFLLGLVIGRSGVLEDSTRYEPVLRRAWKWLLLVGLVGNVLLLVGYAAALSWAISVGIHIGAPALAATYACWVLLNANRLRALAPVGQMALTNYLTHSLICTSLFYGYGFGLYDQVSPTITLLLVLVIYGTQLVLSKQWMARFRFGPAEWLWRSLTYGKVQPFLRTESTAV